MSDSVKMKEKPHISAGLLRNVSYVTKVVYVPKANLVKICQRANRVQKVAYANAMQMLV